MVVYSQSFNAVFFFSTYSYKSNDTSKKVPSKRTDYYYCAQKNKEKQPALDFDDPNRKRRSMPMDRFSCGGYLDITSDAQDRSEVVVRVFHSERHTPYCDIQLPPDICKEIDERAGDTPTAIWSDILRKDPLTPLGVDRKAGLWSMDACQSNEMAPGR